MVNCSSKSYSVWKQHSSTAAVTGFTHSHESSCAETCLVYVCVSVASLLLCYSFVSKAADKGVTMERMGGGRQVCKYSNMDVALKMCRSVMWLATGLHS